MTRYPNLDTIDSLEDYRKVPEKELPALAEEIRQFMIENVAQIGGHLASSLGAVELVLAMHRVFSSPSDKLVFDVGHQAYAHKIITGRRGSFSTLRQKGGISGFPQREESVHDAFSAGHATTSISAALGMARAMKLRGESGVAVALIGDGALTGGMAFEALNDAGQANLPLVVVVNDNDMSISRNVGMLHRQLTNMRISKGYVRFKRALVRMLDTGPVGRVLSRHMLNLKNRIKNFLMPHLLFEEMGFVYLGPIDGHDVHELIRILNRAKDMRIPVIVHAVTVKGKGYDFSEQDPEKFHGIAPFCVDTGCVDAASEGKDNAHVFGETLCRLAESDPRIVAVTAAMRSGTGLSGFAERFPDRFFDVGIAEQHAVTMAAGMASGGLRPVVAIYSTFLQRGYDQLIHDVCLQKLPVIFAVDRAGLVGADGVTHQGVYDIAYLSQMPNMTVLSPATQQELVHMLELALTSDGPIAIRYNRGSLMQAVSEQPVAIACWEELLPIAQRTVIATGDMVELALPAARECGAGLVNARCLKPMDDAMLTRIANAAKRVVVVEDGVDAFGMSVAVRLPDCRVTRIHVPDRPIQHASVAEQRAECGMTVEAIRAALTEDA